MIKREAIERIREAVDIVELIGSYIPLKKVGSRYRGLCPFHLEKNPSFYVDRERGLYHCFGCGEGGTAISFLMKYEKMTFAEAVRFLAKRVGIDIEEEQRKPEEKGVYEVMEFACNLFNNYLYYYPNVLKYLRDRGIKEEVQKAFRLGYAPGNRTLLKEARKKEIPLEILRRVGLIVEKDGEAEDFFFARLIFPIFSLSGKIIGFGGRTLEEGIEPKYLNSPETEIFKKGENLYGFYQAKKFLPGSKAILVEGYFDLLSLTQAGINNCLAPLGTAFTLSQALLIKRYCRDLYISFDGDAQGRESAKKAGMIALRVGLNPLIVELPDGYDPDKFVREKGKEAYQSLLANAKDLVDFLLTGKDLSRISERREMIGQFQEIIPEIGDEILRELYLNKVAEIFKVKKEIFSLGKRLRPEEKNGVAKAVRRKEERLLSYILLSPEYAQLSRSVLPVNAFPLQYQPIVDLLYRLCDRNFTPSEVCDLLEREEEKKLVTTLTFREESLPEKKDFLFLLKRVLADTLKEEIGEDEEKLKKFLELKRNLMRKK
ncbi:MAG: DNA primase [candidate division WOR-3 bacterium]